jgi:hypothetical protein
MKNFKTFKNLIVIDVKIVFTYSKSYFLIKILRQSIPNENFLLKDVEKKIIEMDNSIEFYRSYIIADRKKKKKKKKVKRIYLTEQGRNQFNLKKMINN